MRHSIIGLKFYNIFVTILLSALTTADGTMVPNGLYSIHNLYQGTGRSLSSSEGPAMTDNDKVTTQLWTVINHPTLSDVLKLTSFGGQSLTLNAGGQPSLSARGIEGEGQWFKLVPSSDTPNIWRLNSLADPSKCLGVQTTTQTRVKSLPNADYSGNYWSFDTIEDPPPGPISPITGSPEVGPGEIPDPIEPPSPPPIEPSSLPPIEPPIEPPSPPPIEPPSPPPIEPPSPPPIEPPSPPPIEPPSPPPVVTTSDDTIPNGVYRVKNYYQGPGRSLGAGSWGPKLGNSADSQDQLWTVTNHPSMSNVIKLTSSVGKTLILPAGGRPSLASSPSSSNNAEWFTLVHSPDTDGIWRLQSLANPQRCLGVQTTTATTPQSLASADYSGNYWSFEPADGRSTVVAPLPTIRPIGPAIKKPTTNIIGGRARSGQFRIGNIFQGLCRSLVGAKMAKTAHTLDQFWTITDHPTMSNVVKLSNSQGQTLTFPPRGQPSMTSGSNGENDWYKLVPATSNPTFYRLVSLTDTTKCLSVASMSADEVTSGANEDLQLNYWSFDQMEKITGIPAGYDRFYRKYINIKGIPIVSSAAVPDAALYQAYFIVRHMLSVSPQALSHMVRNRAKLAVMGAREVTTNVPEHRFLGAGFWDTRARGLGGTIAVPTASCAEENLLCYRTDKYAIEDITIHEFSHSVQNLGLNSAIRGFSTSVQRLYDNAIRQGKYASTYARENSIEYFAEGVQNWFNVNGYSNPPNGIHNHVHDRASMKSYDPGLYNLLALHFPADTNKCSCH